MNSPRFRRVALSLILAAFTSILLACAPVLYAQDAQNPRVIRLSLVNGNVQIQPVAQQGSQQGWQAALDNMPLQQGDTLATGDGVAEVEFENGATGFLGDNSALQFTELSSANGGLITRLSLMQGTARAFVHVGEADVFEIKSGDVIVSPQESSDFRVDSYADGVSISVFKGQASVVSPRPGAGSQTTVVEQGHMLSFHSANPDAIDITEIPSRDQFDAWAEYNNALIIEGLNNALNYMGPAAPYAYSYGMADLSNYGSWSNLPGYGWAWQPFGVNSTWIPFSNGIWRFAPHLGYCWVSAERWGWLPFHFGNWVHAPQGWAWIPSAARPWQPAVVGWVRVGDQVGWVARAPGDQPNKLPANVKYGVITKPVETTTAVLRGPNHVLTSDQVRNARIINEPSSKVLSAAIGRSAAPFTVQAPTSRTPPFRAPIPSVRSGAAEASRTIAYDPVTHTYVNAPATNRYMNRAAIRDSGRPAAPPSVAIPLGRGTENPATTNPATGNHIPANGLPNRATGAGRPPIGEPRMMPVRPAMPVTPAMPRSLPMPSPAHPAITLGAAPSAAGHPAPAGHESGHAATPATSSPHR